jgi:hypothetical protein
VRQKILFKKKVINFQRNFRFHPLLNIRAFSILSLKKTFLASLKNSSCMHCHQHLVIHQLFVCSPFPSIRSLDISFRRVYVMNALEKFFVLSFMPVEVYGRCLSSPYIMTVRCYPMKYGHGLLMTPSLTTFVSINSNVFHSKQLIAPPIP